MKNALPLFTIFLLILMNSCGVSEQKLTIIATTDVHGAFESLSAVNQYVLTLDPESERILLDNGDIIQGDPAAYYYNFEQVDQPHLFSRIMHFMNYDAATVGNHDIEAGHAVYDKIRSELKIPWMAANCVSSVTGEPYFDPYTIIRKGSVKIAILGLITPRIPDWLPKNIWSGMRFDDMVAAAAKWVPIIEETEKPDILIGLFHAGVDFTYNDQTRETQNNENAVQLVIEQVAGFDLVFCGHDHKTWNQYFAAPGGDSVLVLGSQSSAREIAQADFTLSREGRKWKITSLNGETIDMRGKEADPAFDAEFQASFEEVDHYIQQDVAVLKNDLDSREAFFGPSAFMTLIHQAQLDISGADLSFAAPLAFNRQILAGPLTVGDLFDLYRFENLLYTMSLTGEQIQSYLNYSYSQWFSSISEGTGHLISMVESQDGHYRTKTAYYNFDSCLGLDYEVDLTQAQDQMVIIHQLSNGDPFDPKKIYTVAVNSYRGNGGGGLMTAGAGLSEEELDAELISSTDKDLRYYLKSWLQERGTVNIITEENWKVIPASRFDSLRDQDYNLLFRN